MDSNRPLPARQLTCTFDVRSHGDSTVLPLHADRQEGGWAVGRPSANPANPTGRKSHRTRKWLDYKKGHPEISVWKGEGPTEVKAPADADIPAGEGAPSAREVTDAPTTSPGPQDDAP